MRENEINLKTNDTAKATHLSLGNVMLWMTFQARIMYTCHLQVKHIIRAQVTLAAGSRNMKQVQDPENNKNCRPWGGLPILMRAEMQSCSAA
jgi:hypothetical protein